MKADENKLEQETADPSVGEMSEAEIDNNLKDTFPASDPPAWTLGSDHRSEVQQKAEDVFFQNPSLRNQD